MANKRIFFSINKTKQELEESKQKLSVMNDPYQLFFRNKHFIKSYDLGTRNN